MNNFEKNVNLPDLILKRVKDFIESNRLERPTFIVGLSGGADSVSLAKILNEISKELNFKLIAAHFDHQWRADSHKDRQFCQKFCENEKIELITGFAQDFESQVKKSRSKEEFGRFLRMAFFDSILKKTDANAIILAHHAKDQIETFFIRLVRGSSLTGLSAMREWNRPFFRPMLECDKMLIDQFVSERNLEFITDPTNNSEDFLRNRIRLSLLPIFEQIDSRFYKKALETIKNLSQENQILDNIAQTYILKDEFGVTTVNINNFLNLEKPLQFRVLIKLLSIYGANFKPSQSFLSEVVKFLKINSENCSKKHAIGIGFSIHKKNGFFFVKS